MVEMIGIGPTRVACDGGDNRNRTGDLLLAKQALSQLSYTPIYKMVDLAGLEPATSRLSSERSNQLS